MDVVTNRPIEILKSIVQKRNWHQGRIERRLAAMTKFKIMAGKVSHEKASAILELLGWEKLKEEVWQNNPDKIRSSEENIKLSVKATKAVYPESKKMDKKIHFTKRKG